jgi:branched-chain amino acid transport system substrate-binding protein
MALQDYKLLRQLGSSAASEVWYALDSDGRPVVVKLLKRKNYPADVRRFEHEAACAERLVSPHVAQVRESGMEPQLFIVFEYIHGKDLAEVAPIRDLREYLKTAVAIAAGLAAIHEQGIAHRDIKPENVRYERHGHAKIIDLGIALTKREGDRQSRCEDPPGTQGWMAPERGQGQLLEVAAEQKADIFSTGLLLSYLRTGIHPFGMDRREIDNSAVQQEIDNPAVQPELARVDEHLRVLFSKTLEREPTRRPEAKELLRVLLRLAQHQPGSLWRRIGRIGEPIRKLTGSRRKSVLVVVVLLATLGLLTYVLFPKNSNLPPSQPPLAACPIGQYLHNSGDAVLRFGAMLPESGPLAAEGPQQFAAVELALSDIRAAGGVPGIQIVPLDKVDEGDPALDTACQSTDTLLRDGVDVIIGPSSSAVTHKVIDRVTSAGTILFSPANTAPEFTDYKGITDGKGDGLYFRTAASDALQGRVLGKAVSDDGNKNVLVISRHDPYGDGLSQAVERSMRQNRIDVLPAQKYDPQAMNFGPLVKTAVNLHPDAIVLIGFDETAHILAGLRNAGITPQNKRIYGTEGNMRETLPGLVSPEQDVLNGMRGTTRPLTDPNFAKRLDQSVGGGLVEFTYAAEAYDAVIVSALAAASAHSDNPTNIAAKINKVAGGDQKCTDYANCIEKIKRGVDIDYVGVSGPLDFNDTGEPCMASYSVVQFDGNGKLVRQRTADASNCIKFH